MNNKRLCVFFACALMLLYFLGFTQAQTSLVNFRWLSDTGLALCGQPENSEQWETVKSWGVNATLNLRGEAQDDEAYLDSIGIEYYYLPVINSEFASVWDVTEEQVEDGVQWINSKLAEGKKVLIHCELGQNRAPTMAMMWYIHEGHTAEEAYNWVVQYPISEPYEYQKQRAADYYNWLQQQATPTPSPTPPTPATTPTPAATPSPASTPAPASEDFPIALVAAASGASIIGVGLLAYLKKRKR